MIEFVEGVGLDIGVTDVIQVAGPQAEVVFEVLSGGKGVQANAVTLFGRHAHHAWTNSGDGVTGMAPSAMAAEILDLMENGAAGEIRIKLSEDVPGFAVPLPDLQAMAAEALS